MSRDSDGLLAALGDLSLRTGQDCMPDRNGVVTFSVERFRLSIEAHADGDIAYFHVPLARLSDLPGSAIRQGLCWNLFRQTLPGSWLALDSQTDEILLCHAAAKGSIDAERILTILDGLIAAAEDAVDALAGGSGAPAPVDIDRDAVTLIRV